MPSLNISASANPGLRYIDSLVRSVAILVSVGAVAGCSSDSGPGGSPGDCVLELAQGGITCDSNATCTDTSGSYGCECNSGYYGDGTTCQVAGGVEGPPLIFGYHIRDAHPDRIYFQSSEPISAGVTSGITGFAVSGKTLDSVQVNVDGLADHYFVVDEPFDFWQNNTIRYEGGSDLRDADGIGLFSIDLQYIDNEIAEPAPSAERYVSVDAPGGGDGMSESTPWTLDEAFDQAMAGMTVWIKAGAYGDHNLSPTNSGQDDAPIKFVGYKSSPGDISSMYFVYTIDATLDPSEMPLITGTNVQGEYGFRISNAETSNIIFRNLQAQNYYGNFEGGSSRHIIFDNCVSDNAWHLASSYSGAGFSFRGQDGTQNRIINSVSINGAMADVRLYNSFSLIENVKAYGDNTSANDPDYYINIRNVNNIVRNCFIKRAEQTPHGGHGFTMKAADVPTEYNLAEHIEIQDCVQSIEIRHHEVRFNVYRDIESHSTGVAEYIAGLLFTGGSHNIIDGAYVHGTVSKGVLFIGSSGEDPDTHTAGEYNIIKNSIFRSDGSGPIVEAGVGAEVPASNNQFINCTFDNFRSQQTVTGDNHGGQGNQFINSTFSNITRYSSNMHAHRVFADDYLNCNFDVDYSREGVTDQGMAADPQFTDVAIHDFTPLNPALRAGLVQQGVEYDRHGVLRPATPTLGAVEMR